MKCIENYVEPGSTIISDLWSAYKVLDKHPSYSHQTVNNSENFVDATTGAHTNSVESMWRDAKSKNKKMHGTNRDMIDSYLADGVPVQKACFSKKPGPVPLNNDGDWKIPAFDTGTKQKLVTNNCKHK